MSQTILHLTGPAARGVRVDALLLRELLDTLVDAVQQSVRLRTEGRSRAAGPAPAWLAQAAAFSVEIQAGSTQLVLDAKALGDLVPERFAQVDLFQPLDPRMTCIDVFAAALDDALVGKADSDLFDDGLVDTLTRFGKVLEQNVDTFEIRNGRTRSFNRQSVESLRQLRRSMPADQRVLVAGKLDLLKHSSRMFSLLVSSGELRGLIVSDPDFARLGQLLGQHVMVSGIAKFRPSGKVLRIEADRIELATGDTSPWEQAPQPLFAELDLRALRVPQGPKSGVAAIFGQWPGDETDEEFERAMRALS